MSSQGPIASDSLKRYIYLHVDPETGIVRYVGKGTGGRAWDCALASRGDKDHHRWLTQLLEQGYTPADWVQIVEKGLDETTARAVEASLIEKFRLGSLPLRALIYGAANV